MSELNFAKSFLNALDSKSTKYQADHVFDPESFQMRVPFLLPKLSHPPHPLSPSAADSTGPPPPPGSEPSAPRITIVLKSPRNPNLTLTLPECNPAETTVASLKLSVQSMLGGPEVVSIEKIKILRAKKPIPVSKKTVADVLEAAKEKEIEFGVMVMGGAPDPPIAPKEAQAGPPSSAPGSAAMEGLEKTESPNQTARPSGLQLLAQKEFWDDLQGFLKQRLRDEGEAGKLRALFEEVWRKGSGG